MNSESDEILELEAALREDLPNERDEARLRARLTGLGLGVGVTLTSATAAALAGSKSTASAGLWGFLGSLPLGAKVGIATVVTASAVAGPVYYTKSQAPVAAVPAKQAALRPVAPVAPVARATVQRAANPVLEASAPDSVPAPPGVSPPAPSPELVEAQLPRAATTERAALRANPPPLRDTAPPPPAAAATLGEETRLIDAALSALRRGDRATATEFIRQHEQRFPDGLLRRERERARAALNEHLENRP
jgi:DNA polymerase-3 subunit gamma/tau